MKVVALEPGEIMLSWQGPDSYGRSMRLSIDEAVQLIGAQHAAIREARLMRVRDLEDKIKLRQKDLDKMHDELRRLKIES